VYGLPRRDDGDLVKKEVLRLDVTMNDTPFLMEIPNPLGNLEDDVTRECFGKVRQLDA
jgi:hypothetical protein